MRRVVGDEAAVLAAEQALGAETRRPEHQRVEKDRRLISDRLIYMRTP